MNYHAVLALCAILFTSGMAAPAIAGVESGYSGGPKLTTPWYGRVTEATRQADLSFIAGMRPHHAGALTMSEQYLSDPDARKASLKQLARGIIRNQTFEIAMLDRVESYLSPPVTGERGDYRQIADRDIDQERRYYRSPAPGPLDNEIAEISARDVQFAKAMIIHHQAALDMAHDYLDDPNGANGYLELMCLDILIDQSQEIALMQSIIDRFPGDPDSVKIDSSMIHGMEGMKHGSQAAHSHHSAQE